MSKISIFWHRRDLRLHDNAGLYHALKGDNPVLPLFIFDTEILDKLEDKKDARVEFIHNELKRIKSLLEERGNSILVKYGKPEAIWRSLLEEYTIDAVYANRDYEPYARERDEAIEKLLAEKEIPFHRYKDHVIFEEKEIVKKDGDPYTVFTPYSRRWKEKLESKLDEEGNSFFLRSFPTESLQSNFLKISPCEMPSLDEMGFSHTDISIPDKSVSQGLIRNYGKTRNFPAADGTSRLGIHFRFGTISIREKAVKAAGLSDTYLNELIWRDFYAQILANFPHVAEGPFRQKYANIPWRDKEEEFQKWCEGKTGYPIVDAGMRELNQTGYMHNRVRMITASFLTKHLLIDWRWGEAYFAAKLLDFDLASNNGGWQWAAGCGTDAAPYFRIFNPTSQMDKFDKEKKYIKKWVPEYGTEEYPAPMVDHKFARERCLETYKEALN
jgi:deoxyribodipyrimidine photo-lyase